MICEGCGCVFCPDSDGLERGPGQDPPRYCTKQCKKHASAKRARTFLTAAERERRRYLRAVCAAKIGAYPTGERARQELNYLWERGGSDAKRAYQCPVCGLWHLTSSDPADVRVTRRGEHGELTLEALRDLLADEQEMTA